jgi:hypothetical protein
MRTLLLVVFTLVGCVHVKAEDETVKEHLAAARLHDLRANEERAQYDPQQSRLRATPLGRLANEVGPPIGVMESYNPTEAHAILADQELRKANEHVAAAKKLEVFEAKACAGVSAADRSSCPLLASSVTRVEATNEGFTLMLKPNVDAEQVFRRLRCHLAFAIASGFDAPSCPLFLKGTELPGASGLRGGRGRSRQPERPGSITLSKTSMARAPRCLHTGRHVHPLDRYQPRLGARHRTRAA